jgi:putative ABC transport system permease protein
MRPLRAALAVAAVGAGCALAVSVLVVRSSVAASVEEHGRTLAGPADLRVVGGVRQGGVDPEDLARIGAVDGVASVTGVVQTRSLVDLVPDGPHDPDVDGFPVTVLGVPGAPVAVGPRLPVGTADLDVRLRTYDGSRSLRDAPVDEGLAALAGGDAVVLPLADVQDAFGRGDGVDVAYVTLAPGATAATAEARLQSALGPDFAVLSAAEGPPEIAVLLDNVLPMLTLVALFGLGIGAMLVHNAAALSLAERRHDLAVLGALGGPTRTLAGSVLAESMVLGLAGGVVGAALGIAVARPIVAALSSTTDTVAGVPLSVRLSPASVASSLAVGVVLSLLATVGPVRRGLRIDVAAELSGREEAAESTIRHIRRRSLLWLAVLGAALAAVAVGTSGGAIERWQPPVGSAGFALACVAALAVGTQLAPLLLVPLARLLPGSAELQLAIANLRREPRRTGVMVAAVGTAAVTAFLTAGYVRGVEAEVRRSTLANLHGVEVSGPTGAHLEAGLDPELLEVIAATPGVATVHRSAFVIAGGDARRILSVAAWSDPWLDRPLVAGSLDRDAFEAGGAVINVTLARDEGLRPGDTVDLPTADGTVAVPVVAIVQTGGVGGRSVQIPFDLHQRLYGERPYQAVVVQPLPGVGDDELRTALRSAIDDGGVVARVTISTPEEVARHHADGATGGLASFWALQRGLLVVSFVAVISTLLLVGVQRQRELAMLAAAGMEPAAMGRMVVAEAAVVGLVAVAMNAVAGPVLLWALNRTAPLIIGWSNTLRPDWWALVRWGAISLLVAVAAAVWPARRAARTDVLAALQAE